MIGHLEAQYKLIWLVIIALFFVCHPTVARANNLLPLNWNQDSISWSQLQSVFSQNPGYSQFAIRFPNGYVWNANVNALNSLYANYLQHAKTLHYGDAVPLLSFSSLDMQGGISGGVATVPLRHITLDTQAVTQNLFNELDYEKYHLLSILPDWLKNLIIIACNGFLALWDFTVTEARKWV